MTAIYDPASSRTSNSEFSTNMTVRTRFAPSPTGYMHIGGMRTALFNWLWARRNGGQFILRIDDTDQARNMSEALGPILKAFEWLGLDWDEGPDPSAANGEMSPEMPAKGEHGPYFQSKRGEFYQRALTRLLEKRLAYRDFDPPEKTQAERQAAEKAKRPFHNDRRWFEASDSEVQAELDKGTPYVVRFLLPRDRAIVVRDLVRGNVEFNMGLQADPVIVRGNGGPLYNFASVVDDGEMRISHVIRAEEHLSNTPVQQLLFETLGYEIPNFAHIPFVAGPGGKKKLSKRDLEQYRKNPQFKKMFDAAEFVFPKLGLDASLSLDPVMVEYYEKIGYLPDGVFNALSRLGWSLDDKTEYMSREFIVENFSLERVIKSAAAFDPDKLQSFQAHWMGELDLEAKVEGCLPYLVQAGLLPADSNEGQRERVEQVVQGMGDRLVVFSDILKFDEFFIADETFNPPETDPKAWTKRLEKPDDAIPILEKFRVELAGAEAFDAASLDKLLHDFVDREGISIGQIIHALRVAVTGKGAGIGMFDAMAILGKESCLVRIKKTIELAKGE